MRGWRWVILWMLSACCIVHGADKPNIVLILADDLGWTDLHCFGSGYYQTPHIDKLREEGMKFTQAYACQNCAPTRAELMSGQYPPRTGVYTVDSLERGRAKDRKLDVPRNNDTLDPAVVTIAETLHAAGYVTASMGKWHLGEPGKAGPCEQGFDINMAGNHTGSPRGGYFSPYKNPQLPDGPKGEYLTDRLADEAVKFIDDHADKPFFLYLPHYAVHTPIQAREDLIKKYKAIKPVGKQNNPEYAAMIDSVDQSVGRIVDALDAHHLTEHTIVIFLSDNGGVGGYDTIGLGDFHSITDNAPLKGGKGSLYEGGIRVPMIVRWPGVVKPGSQCATAVDVIDFYPTLAAVAGAALPKDQPLDGVDISPLFHGRTIADRTLFWHFPGYLEGGKSGWRTAPVGVIHEGDYKLLEYFEDGHVELYNLSDDLGEKTDLSKRDPKRAAAMRDTLAAWRKAVNAPMPHVKE